MQRANCGSWFAAAIAMIGGFLAAGCGQTAPSPSTPETKAASEEAGLYCKEHGGLPEEICTLCHPEAAKKYNIEMCPDGHKLPKHFCEACKKKA